MEKIKSSILSQDKTQSTGLNLETRREVVITVGANTLPRDALLVANSAFTVKRRTISIIYVGVVNIAKVVVAIVNPDSVNRTSMKWKPMTLMMTASGILMNRSQFTLSSQLRICIVQSKPM